MGIRVYKDFFETRDDVLRDIMEEGTWPATALSPPHSGLPIHSHGTTFTAYVISGATDIYDEESGHTFDIKAGDKLVLPAGVRHAEGAVSEEMVYILGLADCVMLEDAIEQLDAVERQ